MSKKITKIENLMEQNVNWLLDALAGDEDAQKAVIFLWESHLQTMGLVSGTAEELRKQRDAALDEVQMAYAFQDAMERNLDDLLIAIEDLRKQAEHPEKILARMVQYEFDFEYEDAVLALELLTGRTDVYLSHYTKDDVREQLEVAIEQIREERAALEEEGGPAD